MPPQDKVSKRANAQAHDRFKAELVNIARHIFLREGYASVTIRRITAAAGVTPMAFYWYFDSKDTLLSVIWNDLLVEAAQDCRLRVAELPPQSPPLERLIAYFEAFLRYWLAHRDHFRFVFLSESSKTDLVELRQHLLGQAGAQAHFQQFSELVQTFLGKEPEEQELAEQVRALAMYQAFGFLYCAIAVYNLPDELAESQVQMVSSYLYQTLNHGIRA